MFEHVYVGMRNARYTYFLSLSLSLSLSLCHNVHTHTHRYARACRDDLARQKQKWYREKGIIYRSSMASIEEHVERFRERHEISVREKLKHETSRHLSSLEILRSEHEEQLNAVKNKIKNRLRAKRREERRANRLRDKMRSLELEIDATSTSVRDSSSTSFSTHRPESSSCELCFSRFSSWFRKRYKCEVCGFDVCGKCSHLDSNNSRQRLCVVCANTINDPLVVSVGRSGSHDLGDFEDFLQEETSSSTARSTNATRRQQD
jgi:hypothetical protein